MSQDYCSILTQKLNVDGCGTAPTNIKYFLFVETPQPWPENEKTVEGFPNYTSGLAKGTLKIHLLAPGKFSKVGFKKILFFELANDDIGHYNRKEFLVPDSEKENLIKSLFSGEDGKFSKYKNNEKDIRDFFICGHMAHDQCCGTFGDNLFKALGSYLEKNPKYSNVRTWQTSHLKGHKFAPSIVEFPEGRFWSHLNQDKLFNKVLPIKEIKDIKDLKMHIRGLAGTNEFGQLAERELFLLNGPSWREKKKLIEVTENPQDKNNATVKVTFTGKSGMESKIVTVNFLPEKIEVSNHLCGEPSTFKKPTVTVKNN